MEAPVKVIDYTGTVLQTYEVNGRDDSDFYAIVWDEETQQIRVFEYGSTRYGGFQHYSKDALPDVEAKAKKWLATVHLPPIAIAYCQRKCLVISKGDTVKVIAGRKVPKGTEGKVVWYGANEYYKGGRYISPNSTWDRTDPMCPVFSAESKRISIDTAEYKRVFLLLSQVEKLNVPEVDPADVEQKIQQWIRNGYRSAMSLY